MIDDMKEDKNEYKVEFLGEKHSKEYKTFKVIILGLCSVGKTTIIGKLMKKPDKIYEATISLDIQKIQIKVNDKIIQIQFWDPCGNDEFAANTPNLFKNASLAILVFAINSHQSFENLRNWYNLIKAHSLDSTLLLIGNKIDLEEEREVTMEEVENFKNSYDDFKIFFETSATNGENIDKLFENIGIELYKKLISDEKNMEDILTKRIELKKEDFSNNKENKKRKSKICCL
jgi:small GTP-binding protein